MTNAEARFNNSLRPRKPEGSLGRTSGGDIFFVAFMLLYVHGGGMTY